MADNGSIRKFTYDGVTYDILSSCNITFNRSLYEKEAQSTTGRNRQKATKRVQTIEGLEPALVGSEMELLASQSDDLTDKTMSIELADGSIYKSTGQLFFENYESEDGKGSVTLIPTIPWTAFTA